MTMQFGTCNHNDIHMLHAGHVQKPTACVMIDVYLLRLFPQNFSLLLALIIAIDHGHVCKSDNINIPSTE